MCSGHQIIMSRLFVETAQNRQATSAHNFIFSPNIIMSPPILLFFISSHIHRLLRPLPVSPGLLAHIDSFVGCLSGVAHPSPLVASGCSSFYLRLSDPSSPVPSMDMRRRTIAKPCYEHASTITSELADPSHSYNEISRKCVVTHYHVTSH
jgi:hypothetical protein